MVSGLAGVENQEMPMKHGANQRETTQTKDKNNYTTAVRFLDAYAYIARRPILERLVQRCYSYNTNINPPLETRPRPELPGCDMERQRQKANECAV
jgi:hypothetical protein